MKVSGIVLGSLLTNTWLLSICAAQVCSIKDTLVIDEWR